MTDNITSITAPGSLPKNGVTLSQYFMIDNNRTIDLNIPAISAAINIAIPTTANMVNIKNYGATGNGVIDDTVAIQAAFNYAITNGGQIFIPNGTYLISSSITSSAIGTEVIGQSWNAILKRSVGFTGTVLQLTGANSVAREFTIDDNGLNQTTSTGNALTNNGNYALSDHLQIINIYRMGINFDGNYTRVNNCTLIGVGSSYSTVQTGQGVWAATVTYTGKQVTNCTITNTGIEGIAIGGAGYLVSGNYLSGCHQYASGGGGQIVCYPQTPGSTTAHGIITKNVIYGGGSNQSDGIELVGPGILCSDNFLYNINGCGIAVDYGFNQSIVNNVMINMGLAYSGTNNLGLACGIILFNNTGSSVNCLIEGNQVSDNQSTPTTTCGVFVSNGAGANCSITSNQFQNLLDAGVVCQGTWPTNLSIINNKGIDDVIITVASSATITLPINPIINLTGTTNITAITGAVWLGRVITVIPNGVLTITLSNSLTTTANVPFQLVYNNAWYILGGK